MSKLLRGSPNARHTLSFFAIVGLVVIFLAYSTEKSKREKAKAEKDTDAAELPFRSTRSPHDVKRDRVKFHADLDAIEEHVASVRTPGFASRVSSIRAALTSLRESSTSSKSFQYGPLYKEEIERLLNETLDLKTASLEHSTRNGSRSTNISSLARQWRTAQDAKVSQKVTDSQRQVKSQIAQEAAAERNSLQVKARNLNNQLQAKKTDEQRAKREAEFANDLGEIKKLLVPFTSPGTKYTSPERQHVSPQPKPVSLTFLQQNGYLRQNANDMHRLMETGNRSGRPQGSFPRANGGLDNNADFEIQAIARAQWLIIKYGDLLVAKGLLSP